MTAPRRLLSRLRELMASGNTTQDASPYAAPLAELVRLVASELVSEVCSVYVQRPGDILELAATEGLNPNAVGRTRLRVGEGIIGLCAATATVENLPDAQNHPAFAYRPETGEEPCWAHAGRAGGAEPHAAPLQRRRSGRAGDGVDAVGRGAGGVGSDRRCG